MILVTLVLTACLTAYMGRYGFQYFNHATGRRAEPPAYNLALIWVMILMLLASCALLAVT